MSMQVLRQLCCNLCKTCIVCFLLFDLFRYKGAVLNAVDTPGHADFGGEVERSALGG